MTTQAPYGSWPSPISPEMLTAGVASLQDVRVGAGATWWLEVRAGGRRSLPDRPAQRRRQTRPTCCPTASRQETGARVRRRRIRWTAAWSSSPTGPTSACTGWSPGATRWPSPPSRRRPHALRYADGVCTPDGQWVICIRESHDGPSATEVRNEIVAIRADGSAGFEGPREPCVLASGRDFVSAPPCAAATGGSWPGSRGTTRTCRGTTPSCGSATSTTTVRASWWWTEPGEKRVVLVSR